MVWKVYLFSDTDFFRFNTIFENLSLQIYASMEKKCQTSIIHLSSHTISFVTMKEVATIRKSKDTLNLKGFNSSKIKD